MALYCESFEAKGCKVTLRNAEPEDAQALIDLVNACDRETTYLSREPGEFDLTPEKERELLARWKESKTNLYLAAQVEGKIIGSCQASCPAKKRYAHKASVAVALRQEYCGLGIGRRMLLILAAWGRENGLSHLELEVDTENLRAVKLYTDVGFQVSGRKYRDKRLADGTYRDSYLMYLPLNP